MRPLHVAFQRLSVPSGTTIMTWVKIPPASNDDVEEFGRCFKRKARFLVDESAGDGLAHVLREEGWNAPFAGEVGLAGHSDEDVFAFAWRYDRVILTHDRRFFLDDANFPFNRNPGVVVLPGGSGEPGFIEAVRDALALIGRFREAYRTEKIMITQDQIWSVKGWDKKGGRHYNSRYRFGDGSDELMFWEDE
jgi:predicted nuclease of predicted toxin-antitoxin system